MKIDQLPGKHLYFLDDHLLGNPKLAFDLFNGMTGMNRVFQGAATVQSILEGNLIEKSSKSRIKKLVCRF